MSFTQKDLYRRKIKTIEELRDLVGPPANRTRKVLMCHGVFDIVHPGHLRHLLYAKEHADVLVASITADEHIKKGNFRPYVPEDLRALNLAALEIVDYVVIDRQATPIANLKLLQPDLFAKGFEYSQNAINPKTREEIEVIESYGGEILFTPGDVVYSSSALIEAAPPNLAVDMLLTTMEAEGLDFDDLATSLQAMRGITVHVVGDTIVDTHTNATLIGGLTKTPTFSVKVESKTNFVGGAAIVAKHLRAAGAEVHFSTILGDDSHKDFVVEDLREAGIEVHCEIDENRPTTNKDAIVCGGYKLLKIDTVDSRPISAKTVERISRTISDLPSDIVVFSDFRHGIFNRDTIPVLSAAIPAGRFRVADSQVASRWGNILDFKGFNLITPNEREARFALGDQDSVIRPLATQLYEMAECETLILKLGDRGVLTQRTSMHDSAHYFHVVGSFVDRLIDPVGAGDALLAYAALAKQATGSELIASILGSFAAAVECERNGNLPVTPGDVLAKIDHVRQQATLSR